jgi:hypothetical protein
VDVELDADAVFAISTLMTPRRGFNGAAFDFIPPTLLFNELIATSIDVGSSSSGNVWLRHGVGSVLSDRKFTAASPPPWKPWRMIDRHSASLVFRSNGYAASATLRAHCVSQVIIWPNQRRISPNWSDACRKARRAIRLL